MATVGCEDENDTSDGIERRKPVYSADFTKGWGSFAGGLAGSRSKLKNGNHTEREEGGR